MSNKNHVPYEVPLAEVLEHDQAYRETRLKLHPDRQESGSHEGFVKTQHAYDLLKRR